MSFRSTRQLELSDHGLGFGDIVVLMLLCLFCASFHRSAEDKPDSEAHLVTCIISPYRLIDLSTLFWLINYN